MEKFDTVFEAPRGWSEKRSFFVPPGAEMPLAQEGIGYVANRVLLPAKKLPFGNSGTLHTFCTPFSKESTGAEVG